MTHPAPLPAPPAGPPNVAPLTAARPAVVARRTLVVAGVLAAVLVGLLLLWFARRTLLLAFAGVLVAVFLSTPASVLHERVRLPYRVALLLTVAALIGVVALAVTWRGPAVASQFSDLRDSLPQAAESLRARIAQYPWGQRLLEGVPTVSDVLAGNRTIAGGAQAFVGRALGLVSTAFIILFTGLFIAVEPSLYVRGVVRLVTPARRGRAREVLGHVGHTLRWWLVAKLVSMTVIGVGTGVGLHFLGVPLVFTLGLIAAVFTFVPNIGPILSAVPAVLLALVQGPQLALWVVLLYAGVQTIESYLITPYLERRTVSLPPALTLIMQVLLGTAGGVLGVALAAPLTAVGLVLTRALYVHDVLGDPAVDGEL